jgi:hypothetical protein
MAVAPELLEEGAAGAEGGEAAAARAPAPTPSPRQRSSGGAKGGKAAAARAPAPTPSPRQRSSGGDWLRTGGAAYGSVSSPSAAAQTVTKILWAVAVGLVVLEIAAEATGQRWSFTLPGIGRGPAPRSPYLPLYAGQTLPAASALPGVLGPVQTQSPATNLSGRAGGNLAV